MEIIGHMKMSRGSNNSTTANNAANPMKTLMPATMQQHRTHYGNDMSMLCSAAFPAQSMQTTSPLQATEALPPPTCLDCTAVGSKPTVCCTQWPPTVATPAASCCALPNRFDSYACCNNFNANHSNTYIPATLTYNFLTTSECSPEDDVAYEYQEPEENFISIDDAKIKGFLLQIGQQQAQLERQASASAAALAASATTRRRPIVYEIIDLDNAEERKKLQRLKCEAEADNKLKEQQKQMQQEKMEQKQQQQQKQLPVSNSSVPMKVLAQIDLSEHSSNDSSKSIQADSDSDESALPLAAVAVSCELACEDNDNRHELQENDKSDIVIIPSDDDDDDDDDDEQPKDQNAADDDIEEEDDKASSIDEQEQGVEVLYIDLEQQKDQRTFFECYLCGKKVQSSYNLRRHMMIHTGERPFGCDICERRFREFSDLKKHRRRHMHEPNFFCMICRIKKPREEDPTRCKDCDTRNDALATITTGAMKEALQLKQSSNGSKNNLKVSVVTNAITAKPAVIVAASTTTSTSTTTTATTTTTTASPILNTETNVNNAASLRLLNSLSPVQQGLSMRKQFSCPLCKRPFGTRHNLKRHFMIHTGEKPFSCSKCRKPFREYSTLKKHMVTHQRDRLYKCINCPAKFRDFLEYTTHKQSHGAVDNEQELKKQRSNEDSSCDSIEDDEEDENENADADADAEDWLECCECSKRFTDIDSYTEHLREHESEQEFIYECYVCKKTFEERDKLLLHMNEHDQ